MDRKEYIQQLRLSYERLTQRERVLISIVPAVVLVFGLYLAYQPIASAFDAQSKELTRARRELAAVPRLVNQYYSFMARRDQIRQHYLQARGSETPKSYLEKIIKEKAGVTSSRNFKITEIKSDSFGIGVDRVPFKLELKDIESLENVVNFLKEIVYGKQPFVLSKLRIERRPRRNSLDLNVDLNSFRQTQ